MSSSSGSSTKGHLTAGERERRRLVGAGEAGHEAGVERKVSRLEAERSRLLPSGGAETGGDRRISVDAVRQVELGLAVAGQHEEAHAGSVPDRRGLRRLLAAFASRERSLAQSDVHVISGVDARRGALGRAHFLVTRTR